MSIIWITITEVQPKKFENKVLRKTKMEFPEILKEVCRAMERLRYEVFSITTDTSGENSGGLSLLKYNSNENNGDMFLMVIEGTKQEINQILSDPKVRNFMR